MNDRRLHLNVTILIRTLLMRILALETSSRAGSVAALENSQLLEQTVLDPRPRSSRSLAPAINAQLKSVGWKPRDIQLVAVAQGPGSFTGLRVGVTTAKILAYVTGCELIGVNTLAAIAAQAPPVENRLVAILDAQRKQLYAMHFHRTNQNGLEVLRPTEIVDIDHWLAELQAGDTVTGSGLCKLAGQLPKTVGAVDERLWTPTAATVGMVGYKSYQSGKRDDVWKMTPFYYRKSAAEEMRG